MTSPIRVRFAPSPTGYLHVGGARTALFNWLLARKHGGTFILRIEDTDRERSSDAMTQVIIDGMRWLGLDWDEGPLHQADGLERHQRDAHALLERGSAYRCFCTVEELDARRAAAAEAGNQAFRYDRRCLAVPRPESDARANAGESFTLRFRVPEGTTAWDDAVHGRIEVANTEIEDFIVLRSDGTPIYNHAVVSDDIEMRITHVIRGDDHISNTPKQILIYQALGAALPTFAHVPMILGNDGRKLSKRHGATAVGDYKLQGILPAAMRNFLALLGWSPGDDREIMPAEEMVERFSLDRINKKSAVFDTEKLLWMNSQYIAALSAEQLLPVLLELGDAELANADRNRLVAAIELVKVRSRTLLDFSSLLNPYLREDVEYKAAAVEKRWSNVDEVRERLEVLQQGYASLTQWDATALETELRAVADRMGVSAANIIHPLRVALTGDAVGPGIFDVLVTLGRELSLRRMNRAIHVLSGDGVSGIHSS